VRPLVEFAIGKARGRADSFEKLLSFLYTVIMHQGTPYASVGGGLAAGMCSGPDQLVQWPLLMLDHEIFYRGLRVGSFRRPTWQDPIAVAFDRNFASSIETEYEELRITGKAPSLGDTPRARWPIDGTKETDLFRSSHDPIELQTDPSS
jgi:hypothetical protein